MDLNPYISVVIPVYNCAHNLPGLLKALLSLEYPKDRLEVILVDNGSTDASPEILSKCAFQVLQENSIQSSYAARNLGIQRSQGEIVAFTDSDCIPDRQWLKTAVDAFNTTGADMIGGNIQIPLSLHNGPAQLLDGISNLQNGLSITNRKKAFTANLFVKRRVFQKIGFFDVEPGFGGDILFTGNATSSGFTLVYEESSSVFHPPRGIYELMKKSLRVGYGKGWSRVGRKTPSTVADPLLKRPHLQFLNPLKTKEALKRRGIQPSFFLLLQITSLAFINIALMGFGAAIGAIIRLCRLRKRTACADRTPLL